MVLVEPQLFLLLEACKTAPLTKKISTKRSRYQFGTGFRRRLLPTLLGSLWTQASLHLRNSPILYILHCRRSYAFRGRSGGRPLYLGHHVCGTVGQRIRKH